MVNRSAQLAAALLKQRKRRTKYAGKQPYSDKPKACYCNATSHPPCAWCTDPANNPDLEEPPDDRPTTLEDYLGKYAPALAQQAQAACQPLHVPGDDQPLPVDLLRQPYNAQAHVISAGIKALDRQRSLQIAAEMGSGKSLMAQAVCQGHSHDRGYRAIVFCPPHLVGKWEREIRETLTNAHVHHLKTYHDIAGVLRDQKPVGRGWWIVSNTRAKMGAKWRAAFLPMRYSPYLRCPDCQEPIDKWDSKLTQWVPLPADDLFKKKHSCRHCGGALWTYTHELDRWPIAAYVHKHLKGWFDYLIVDECFPAETLITTDRGQVPIADICIGDRVLTRKASGQLCYRRVVRLIAKRRNQGLVRVVHDRGSVTCTPNHKFWVDGHYVEANKLQSGDSLTTEQPSGHLQALRALRQAVPHTIEEAKAAILLAQVQVEGNCSFVVERNHGELPYLRKVSVPKSSGETEILLKALLRSRPEEAEHKAMHELRSDVLVQASSREMLQSSVFFPTQAQAEDLLDLPNGFLLTQAGQEVLLAGVRADGDCEHASDQDPAEGLAVAKGNHRGRNSRPQPAVETEARRGRSGASTGDGSRGNRWGVASQGLPAGSGQSQGEGAAFNGLGGAEVFECGDSRRRGTSSSEYPIAGTVAVVRVEPSKASPEWVYDLEVEDTHCYFAGGVLVSNCHQTKSPDTAVGQAAGSLSAACNKTIFLTGTLFGGMAWHIRASLFRIAPHSLVSEGLEWKNETAFNERYGRMERRVTETTHSGSDNRQSKGTTTKTAKYVRPGVMPTLFGRHLIGSTIFLSLDEVSEALPQLDETVIDVPMDQQLCEAYVHVENAITAEIKQMLAKKDKRLLSRMLHTLLGYPDHPYGWKEIGYYDTNTFGEQFWHHVVTPKSLDRDTVRPKERKLVELVKQELAEGRKCWVYCVMTDARDVNERLRKLLDDAGLRVAVLRASVETTEREAWIARHAPLCDVIVSHPQLVETGLDFFAKQGVSAGGTGTDAYLYNFPTIVGYSLGYSTFTMRQAMRRHWRIGQRETCRNYYLHYADTMQSRALSLMGKKLVASTSIEGKFSSEGLAALAGDEGTLEVALAKSLVERLNDTDVGRVWQKLGCAKPCAIIPNQPPVITETAQNIPIQPEIMPLAHSPITKPNDEPAEFELPPPRNVFRPQQLAIW
jgi:hypothetical protein